MLQPNERVGPSFGRITRSVAANSPKLAPPSLFSPGLKVSAPVKTAGIESFIYLGFVFAQYFLGPFFNPNGTSVS